MAPDDTPNGPNGQTTGTAPDQAAATPSGTDTSTQDPLKVAAQTRLAVDLMNGNTFEALELIKQGVNPNAINALGTTALGGVNENANSVSGVDLSVLNASTVSAATPAPGTLMPTADGGVTTDPALAAPEEHHHHHHAAEIDPILPLDAAALGAAALDVAAVTAMEMGDIGLAARLEQKAEDVTERDNNDQQNNDDGTEGGPSLLQQEADTGIVVDGTISDVGINPDSYMSPTEFDYGTDADNMSMSSFAPAPSYFPEDDFSSTNLDSFSTGADPFAATPNYFTNTNSFGPDPFVKDPFAPATNSFSLDPLGTGAPSLASTSLTGLDPLNIAPITIDPLGTGATTLSANSLAGGSLLTPGAFSVAPLSADPFSIAPLTVDPLSTGATTLSTATVTTPAAPVDPTATTATVTPATPSTPADPTTTTATASVTPATPAAATTTTPATVSLDTLGAGPDPFATSTTLATSTALNTGTPTSSFLGTTLSAYSPATPASAATPSTTFGDLSSLSTTPGTPTDFSIHGTSFFSPTSVAASIMPPANDFSSKAPAIVAAAPRAQTSMGLS